MAKQGTLYLREASSRANWIGNLAKFLGLDFDVVESTEYAKFNEDFPLHKIPALITAKGVKITEALAIIYYLNALSDNNEFYGSNIDETTQVIRWLAFFNQDFLVGLGDWRLRAKTEEDKAAGLAKLNFYLDYTNNELKTRKYIALPDRITVADVFIYNILKKASLILSLDGYDAINAWLAEIGTHPIFQN